jgi:prevent-host-death family protein
MPLLDAPKQLWLYGKAEPNVTAYSVAEAKNTLPKLVDRALQGEEVIITRHGKPVAELRSV